MTIKTLEFIHALLIEKEWQTEEDCEHSRELLCEYEASETASQDLIKRQAEAAAMYMRAHILALDALMDFENQDFCAALDGLRQDKN